MVDIGIGGNEIDKKNHVNSHNVDYVRTEFSRKCTSCRAYENMGFPAIWDSPNNFDGTLSI